METKEQEFEQLIGDKLGMLRGTALRILGNSPDAEDAVQQALLTAWRDYVSFRGRAGLSTWVVRILINVCYDMLRERSRERETLADYGDEETADRGRNDEERLLDRLESAVARLPKLYRESLSLAVLSGKTPDEAAKLLGCTRNTLYQRIHKAKQILAKSIREVSYEEA